MLGCSAALLAGCNSAEEAAAPPDPTLAAVAAESAALVPGNWLLSEDAAVVAAEFGMPGSAPLITLMCDIPSKTVSLWRNGAGTAPAAFVLEAGGQAARLDMMPTADGMAMTAAIASALPIFAAFSAGDSAFAITSPAGEKSQYPTFAGIDRVISACR